MREKFAPFLKRKSIFKLYDNSPAEFPKIQSNNIHGSWREKFYWKVSELKLNERSMFHGHQADTVFRNYVPPLSGEGKGEKWRARGVASQAGRLCIREVAREVEVMFTLTLSGRRSPPRARC